MTARLLKTTRRELRASLRGLEDESWRLYLEECRRLDVRPHDSEAPSPWVEFGTPEGVFARDDADHPLGHGYPTGVPIGEGSHRERWKSILRADPCSYCCRRPGGTVDHVVPRSVAPPRQREGWLNFTGSCRNCNGNKRASPLLLFLLLGVNAPRL